MALIIVGQFAIGAETGLCFVAPEEPIVAMWNRRIPLGIDKHSLPAKVIAAIFVDSRQSGAFHK